MPNTSKVAKHLYYNTSLTVTLFLFNLACADSTSVYNIFGLSIFTCVADCSLSSLKSSPIYSFHVWSIYFCLISAILLFFFLLLHIFLCISVILILSISSNSSFNHSSFACIWSLFLSVMFYILFRVLPWFSLLSIMSRSSSDIILLFSLSIFISGDFICRC